jgi:hypothetical protein
MNPLKIKIPAKISTGSVARRDLIPALNPVQQVFVTFYVYMQYSCTENVQY